MAPPAFDHGPSYSIVWTDELAGLGTATIRNAVSFRRFSESVVSLTKMHALVGDRLAASRAALVFVLPSPRPEAGWTPCVAHTVSQHFHRAVPWRGHVGWIRQGGRRPLRGLGRRP